jgi:hypothetical protein
MIRYQDNYYNDSYGGDPEDKFEVEDAEEMDNFIVDDDDDDDEEEEEDGEEEKGGGRFLMQ